MAEKKTEKLKEKEKAGKAQKEKPAKRTGTVFGGSLNIRPQPNTDADPVGVIRNGEEVEILEDLGDWYKVDAGYVMSRWVK
ncbi:MAG: SH3 domain-containing protein [Parasporobacterium sp.]|nr:SH3 domain-containing protein [Parasporobacterium sp.]